MYQLMWKYAKGKVDVLGVYERPEQAWAAVMRDMRCSARRDDADAAADLAAVPNASR